jgi:hypothetical protein
VGLFGKMTIIIEGGKHSYEFVLDRDTEVTNARAEARA